jgi:hypothetical protein
MAKGLTIEFKTKNKKQLEAVKYWIDNETEEILFGGAKAGGKSFLGASLIFGDALIYPDTHYFIARAELTDLRKFTIPTVYEVFANWGLKFDDYATFNGQDSCFNLYNGSKVFLLACKELPSDPLFERFGSMQMTRGWIEEGGEIAETAKSNLWLSIGRWKNELYGLKKKLLITANPKKGWMKREFVDLYKEDRLPANKKFIRSLVTDNPYMSDDYIKTLSEEKDEVRKQRLFFGDWDYAEDKDSLIDYASLDDTFTNTIVKDNQKYLTVDVARMGNDTTVISYWNGLELFKIDKFAKQDTAQTAQKIKDIANIEQIPYSHIIVDEDGIGGGVVDNLFGVRGFIANSSPLPTKSEIRSKFKKTDLIGSPRSNYRNLKSQCGFKLAEYINEHKISFKTPEYRDIIIEELSALLKHKDADSDGKLQIKPKDDVKQAIGRSPDIGDSLIFRMWFELEKDINPDEHKDIHVIPWNSTKKFNARKNNIAI